MNSVEISFTPKKASILSQYEWGNKKAEAKIEHSIESEWDVLYNKEINNSEIYLVNNLWLYVFAPLMYIFQVYKCVRVNWVY